MRLLRLFHGAAHVVLATALFTGMVHRIPPSKSGHAFGLISIVTLLPYAVIPPFLKVLMGKLGGYPQVLAGLERDLDARGVVIVQVWLNLAWPWVGEVVDRIHYERRDEKNILTLVKNFQFPAGQ